jgi:hypothetical protein
MFPTKTVLESSLATSTLGSLGSDYFLLGYLGFLSLYYLSPFSPLSPLVLPPSFLAGLSVLSLGVALVAGFLTLASAFSIVIFSP